MKYFLILLLMPMVARADFISPVCVGIAVGAGVAELRHDRKPHIAEKILAAVLAGIVVESINSGPSFQPLFAAGYAGFFPVLRNQGFKVENVVLASLGGGLTWSMKFGRGK